jgi:hypothetical protein
VINERTNRNSPRKLRSAAHVITVKMSDENEVDLANSGLPGGCQDAVGISAVVTRPARIDS